MPDIFTGKDLSKIVKATGNFHQRNQVSLINQYLDASSNGVACILYGLRRTGKTTMMLHAIGNLPTEEFKRTAFILAREDDDVEDIISSMRKLSRKGINNFFMDEATSLADFIKNSDRFANIFATYGSHLVLSGTDSLKFNLAKTKLLGRKFLVHTTRISFAEQRRLMPGLTFAEYAKFGGILSGNSILKNFIDNGVPEIFKEYTLSSIAENLQHSLESCQKFSGGTLHELCRRGEMTGPINFCAHYDTHQLLLREFNKTFRSEETIDFLELANKFIEEEFFAKYKFDKKSLNLAQRDALSIFPVENRTVPLTQEILDEAIEIFRDIEMLYPAEYRVYTEKGIKRFPMDIFTQPGVRWGQVETFISILKKRNREANYKIPEELILNVGRHAHGKTFEETLLLETIEACQGKCDVFKFIWEAKDDRKEIDIVITLPEKQGFCAFETKRHDKIKSSDAKHIKNKKLIDILEDEYGPMLDSAVICPISKNQGFHRNVDEFVLDLPALPERMQEMAEGSRLKM